ncbi:hypothetical protein Fcan01_17011 [Folsomia candida]|uniref:F-box domain-containing protein n=1 Tax=Folsomia candida TaxID=158441 RepID=A0A226DRQ2_FOLCA|nr:hypothetical protein Fcan01_17011 [Folsomia candida]
MEPQPDELDPVNLALQNPIIFAKIHAFAGSESGPILRLVCKAWNDVILSNPKRKMVLKLHTNSLTDFYGCCDPLTFQLFCRTIDPRLSRHVRLWQKYCNAHQHSEHHYRACLARFFHFCEKFGDIVVTMEILVRASMLPILYELLTWSCPNLRFLRIRKWCFGFESRDPADLEGDVVLSSITPGLPIRRDLVGLHIGTSLRKNASVAHKGTSTTVPSRFPSE